MLIELSDVAPFFAWSPIGPGRVYVSVSDFATREACLHALANAITAEEQRQRDELRQPMLPEVKP